MTTCRLAEHAHERVYDALTGRVHWHPELGALDGAPPKHASDKERDTPLPVGAHRRLAEAFGVEWASASPDAYRRVAEAVGHSLPPATLPSSSSSNEGSHPTPAVLFGFRR